MPRTEANKHKLNEAYLRSLRPQAKAFLVWDTLQRGFAVRVLPSGRKTWLCIYRRNRRPRWYHIAAADAVGLADARRLAADVMLRVAQGQDPAAERRAQRGAGTFDELATRYRTYAQRKNKSWKQADALVRKNLLPKWAKLPAASITRADVKAMVGRIAAPILANAVLAAASAIFTWAIREEFGGITVNPCVGVDRHETRARERVLAETEIPMFWTAFASAGLSGTVLKMILLTGQRPGEVCAMRAEHVADGWWTLPGQPIAELNWPGTKNKQTHRVLLPAPAQAMMAATTTGAVFAGARVPAIGTAMRAICKALAVKVPCKPHDLRRTHGSLITGIGFGRDAMNRIQNHREGGIADVYDRYQYAEENKRIMETVAARIMELATGTAASNVVRFR